MKFFRTPILCLILCMFCLTSCLAEGGAAALPSSPPETPGATEAAALKPTPVTAPVAGVKTSPIPTEAATPGDPQSSAADAEESARAYVLLVDVGFALMGNTSDFTQQNQYSQRSPLFGVADEQRVCMTAIKALVDSLKDGEVVYIVPFDSDMKTEKIYPSRIDWQRREKINRDGVDWARSETLRKLVNDESLKPGQSSMPGKALKKAMDTFAGEQVENNYAAVDYILLSGGIHSYVAGEDKDGTRAEDDAELFRETARSLPEHLYVVSLKPKLGDVAKEGANSYRLVADNFKDDAGAYSGNLYECDTPADMIEGVKKAYAKIKNPGLADAAGQPMAGQSEQPADGQPVSGQAEQPTGQAATAGADAQAPDAQGAQGAQTPDAQGAQTAAPQESATPAEAPPRLPEETIPLEIPLFGKATYESDMPPGYLLDKVYGDVSAGVTPDGATLLIVAEKAGEGTLTFVHGASRIPLETKVVVSPKRYTALFLAAGIAVFCLLTAQALLVWLMLRARRR